MSTTNLAKTETDNLAHIRNPVKKGYTLCNKPIPWGHEGQKTARLRLCNRCIIAADKI